MLADPLAVTYDGSAKSLPRTSAGLRQAVYRTADGEFEVRISNTPTARNGGQSVSIELTRQIPDPTPTNAFDAYREIRNGFGLTYTFDTTRSEASVDLPRLRTALLAFVDTTLAGRLISGEK